MRPDSLHRLRGMVISRNQPRVSPSYMSEMAPIASLAGADRRSGRGWGLKSIYPISTTEGIACINVGDPRTHRHNAGVGSAGPGSINSASVQNGAKPTLMSANPLPTDNCRRPKIWVVQHMSRVKRSIGGPTYICRRLGLMPAKKMTNSAPMSATPGGLRLSKGRATPVRSTMCTK